MTDHLLVPTGSTLTIQPDVSLRFAEGIKLEVAGNLDAQGGAGSFIVFEPAPGVTQWYGIEFTSGNTHNTSSSISYVVIKKSRFGIYLNAGRNVPSVKNSVFVNNTMAIYGKSSAHLTASVENSRFIQNYLVAIKVEVEETGNLNLRGNVFIANRVDLDIRASQGNITLSDNDFLDSTDFSIKGARGDGALSLVDIDASDNWWGTTDQSAIPGMIYDCSDDPNYGCVEFLPLAPSPVGSAPGLPVD